VIHLLLISALALATPGSVETKEELTMRLLGKAPNQPASSVEAPAATSTEAVVPASEADSPLSTLALPTVVKSQPSASTPVTSVTELKGASLEVAGSEELSNAEANELLRQQALEWSGKGALGIGAPTADEAESTDVESGSWFPWWLPAILFGALGLFALSRRSGGLAQLASGGAQEKGTTEKKH
jgi:hypothetical protein